MSYTALSFPATTTVPASDEFIIAGKSWRIGHFFEDVAAGGQATINFKTPAGMTTLYQLANVGKTGGEFDFTMVEGSTPTGGTALTPFNLERENFGSKVCELTDVKYGVTFTGGVTAPADYLPGEAQGSQRTAGSNSVGVFIKLKPDTNYTIVANNLAETTGNINILFVVAVGI